jgi:threonine/homoserine efflux transporter RhtA
MMANQFATELGITHLEPGKAIMWAYVGGSVGDFSSGFISHALHSRKKAILLMIGISILGIVLLLFSGIKTETMYYVYCTVIGFGNGYWAMFVTVASEQFGTNLRSTATTTVPNMVRGLLAVMLLGFNYFKADYTVIQSAVIIGVIVFTLAIYAAATIKETHNRDLDFVEQ